MKLPAPLQRFTDWRFLLALALGGIVFFQIVALVPRTLEEDLPSPQLEEKILSEGITVKPRRKGLEDKISEYSIRGFQYVSIKKGVKQWKVTADEAFFYQKDGLVTCRFVQAEIYNANGQITYVEGREGQYDMNTRDLELFFDVKTTFPEGLVTYADYTKYQASTREVQIPIDQKVTGESLPNFGKEKLNFESNGLIYHEQAGRGDLLSQVKVKITSPPDEKAKDQTPQVTTIASDQAHLFRFDRKAHFWMNQKSGTPPKFVHIEQPSMTCDSRDAEFFFDSAEKRIQTMRATQDVRIVEQPKPADPNDVSARRRGTPQPRIATGGVAEFDANRDTITLSRYPQVVQGHDTVVGNVIVVHRSTDEVEVEDSNAFTEGNENSPTRSPRSP